MIIKSVGNLILNCQRSKLFFIYLSVLTQLVGRLHK